MAHDFEREARGAPVPAPVPEEFATDGVSAAAAEVLRAALDPSSGRSAGRDATVSFGRVAFGMARGEGETEGRSGRVRSRGVGRIGTRILRISQDSTRGWIAAVCAVMLVVTALWMRQPGADGGVTRTYATSTGEQRQFELSDGTQVLLSPNSALQLANFGMSSRTVTVRGEAYFDVPHASGAAFIVRTGDATVRVLGTAFLVNNRHDSRHSHVVVFDGRVSMTGTGHSAAILSKGQVGDVADSTIRVSETNDLTPGIELRNGDFIFHDMPLVRVLQTLTRWYGYEFRCNDSTLIHQLVSVPVSQRSSAAAVSTLEELLNVTSTVVGDTITLIAQPSAPKRTPAQTRPYDVFVPTREVGR